MKIKQYLLAIAIIALAIGFNSCKKADVKEEYETTFEASGNQAVSNNLSQDAEDIFLEIAQDYSLAGMVPFEIQ